MDDHRKKMIAPVGITALFLAYLAVYGMLLFFVDVWHPVLLVLLIPLAALGDARHGKRQYDSDGECIS